MKYWWHLCKMSNTSPNVIWSPSSSSRVWNLSTSKRSIHILTVFFLFTMVVLLLVLSLPVLVVVRDVLVSLHSCFSCMRCYGFQEHLQQYGLLCVMAWVISWALSMNSTADLSPKFVPWSMSYLREWYMCRRISHWMIWWSAAWLLKTKPGIKLCSCFLCSFFHAPSCGWIMWWYIKHSYISVVSHDSWFCDLEGRWNLQRLGDNVWNSLSFEKG